VAYLVLVGFLAQLLLARGQAHLRGPAGVSSPQPRARSRELVLWNLGVVLVPVGALADTRLAVLAGTVSLLAALLSFAASVREPFASGLRRGLLGASYITLLCLMAASAVTGLGLAWHISWL
jgi:hypothetical protein